MGIRRTVLKTVGYATAPRLTFAALNPKKAAVAKMAEWAVKRVSPARQRRARNRAAITRVGAAVMAVPVGLWLGRKLRSPQPRVHQTSGLA